MSFVRTVNAICLGALQRLISLVDADVLSSRMLALFVAFDFEEGYCGVDLVLLTSV